MILDPGVAVGRREGMFRGRGGTGHGKVGGSSEARRVSSGLGHLVF